MKASLDRFVRGALRPYSAAVLSLGAGLCLGAVLLACGRETSRPAPRAAASAAPSVLSSAHPLGKPGAGASPAGASEGAPQVPPARGTPVQREPGALSEVDAGQLKAIIRAFDAKATLVNVWASWCGPCRDELPMLESLASNLSRDGIRVVLVSADEPEDRDKASAFLRSIQSRLPAYLAARPLGDFKAGMNPRWPGMIPATFLFDGSGKLRYFWGGPVYEHELTQVIEGLLSGKNIDGQADFTLAPGKTERAP